MVMCLFKTSHTVPSYCVLVKLKLCLIGQQMQKLDQLGCPSVWLGYSGATPERHFSPQMSDLAKDATFTNYVVSTMVNKLSKWKQHCSLNDCWLREYLITYLWCWQYLNNRQNRWLTWQRKLQRSRRKKNAKEEEKISEIRCSCLKFIELSF